MTAQGSYSGSELELFAEAHKWRSYWSSQVRGFISGKVLEVGAGLGSIAKTLNKPDLDQWLMLEPDPLMAEFLLKLVEGGVLGSNCKVLNGTLGDLKPTLSFNTI